ncbi:hypothetical protein M2347_003219 [Chryseobacterium sp. H1D6B]|uniref:hypothetical protein n=1 Tax=Chryseobacterium sp. H1D6B TaxID=2940588 RepID=UPI0015CA19C2|nr:hypothetical protein [Chryseobacterium sp. H1D6B]MDH6253492.1 hypothetical protein [Chryseobacterium sp. H1D6B]
MIFEDDKHSVQQGKHTIPFLSTIISFNDNKSFILNSLQKIKSCTLCEKRRKAIENYIKEYTLHLHQHVEYEDQNPDSYQLSPAYARQSYDKVLKEDEYLKRLISAFNIE